MFLPLEMEIDLAIKSPQRTVRASRPAYSSPEKFPQLIIIHFLMFLVVISSTFLLNEYLYGTMNV